MEVEAVTFQKLFQQDVQYEIPVFQREYVWTLEDQWEALWEDIQHTAEEYLQRLNEHTNRAEAQRRTRRHFMGAVVLQQQLGAIADIQKCLVIDGQQRLTTVQLIIDAAREVIEDAAGAKVAERLKLLVFNQFGDGDDRFKLWPASDDREAFRCAMTGESDRAPNRSSRIIEARAYFCGQIQDWLDSHDEDAEAIHALVTTLLGLFEFVSIDLTHKDDPNIIFEVLNARGTPLSPADLIKNLILHQARQEGCDTEVYDIWQYFLDEWWRKEIKQGALNRTRLDIFLNYWLASAVAKEVKTHRIYNQFTDYVEQQRQSGMSSIHTIASEIKRCGKIYRAWHAYVKDPNSEWGKFFYRGWRCGLGSMTPLILWLFKQPDHTFPKGDLQEIVKHIESFLVRRAMCRVMTAGLNRFSITLVRQVDDVDGSQICARLVKALRNQRGALRWPKDDELEQAVLRQPLVGRVGQPKLRMILAAIEEQRRADDVYTQSLMLDVDKLTIEHIMPRSWEKHWPLPGGADHEVELTKRNREIDTLGNLTLLTARLNAHISNGPWQAKRAALSEHPGLYINHDVVQADTWSSDAIQDRGQQLFQNIIELWPYPKANDAEASCADTPELPSANRKGLD